MGFQFLSQSINTTIPRPRRDELTILQRGAKWFEGEWFGQKHNRPSVQHYFRLRWSEQKYVACWVQLEEKAEVQDLW